MPLSAQYSLMNALACNTLDSDIGVEGSGRMVFSCCTNHALNACKEEFSSLFLYNWKRIQNIPHNNSSRITLTWTFL